MGVGAHRAHATFVPVVVGRSQGHFDPEQGGGEGGLGGTNAVVGGVAFGAVGGGATGALVLGGVAGDVAGVGGGAVPAFGGAGAGLDDTCGAVAAGAVGAGRVGATVAAGAVDPGAVVAVDFFTTTRAAFACGCVVVVVRPKSGCATGTFGGAATAGAPDAAGALAPSAATIAKNDDVLSPAATMRPRNAG
jgi:hypothetical protein